jgi:hypothetical protein
MRSLQKTLLILTMLPVAAGGCSSDSNGGGTGGTGGSSGGSGGSTGGTTGGSGGSTGGTTGGTGTGGATGGSGGSTGGTTGGTGTGGTTGGTSGAGDGGAAVACGMGKTTPTSAAIDNFDGMKQVIEWRVADATMPAGAPVMPMGALTVPVTGKETLALGALATWAASSRPCMDASAYTGIRFKVSGDVDSLEFRVPTPATLPLADGGVCANDSQCGYAHYRKVLPKPTATLTMVQVPFSELTPPWGAPAPFDKSAVLSVVFLVPTDMNTAHKFTIDDIEFY